MEAPLFTTIDGLKRRAKKLRREQGIPHHQALDAISMAGGFQNFAHARRSLTDSGDE